MIRSSIRIRTRIHRTTTDALASLATGLLAGTAFWGLHAPSPAPPWLGLTGLLGIVLGERAATELRDRHHARRHPAARTEQAEPINPTPPGKP